MNAEIISPIGVLPNGWVLDRLVNLTTKIGSGATPRGGESAYLPDRIEYAFVRSQNVFDYHFSQSGLKFISSQDKEKLKGVHLQSEDILLNITGDGVTFARACLVPDDILPAAVNQHVSIIRVNKTKCLPGYLLAYLCLPQIKEYIANFNAGGSRRAITKGHIESFEVPLAPMHIQKYVQKVTFDFINKIEVNSQTNQTLEEIAQAIFKSWFVDFDPMRAKIEAKEKGQDPELAAMAAIAGKSVDELDTLSDEQLDKLKNTTVLFPDKLVESEFGEIPEGWSWSEIGNEVDVVGGGTPSTKKEEFWEGGNIHWTSPKDMSNSTDKILLETGRKITKAGLEKISSGLLPKNTVLMSSRAPVGYLAISKIDVAINQGYIAMKCKGKLTPEYVVQWAESIMDDIKQRASGTTFAEISKKNFKVIPVIVPHTDVLRDYTKTVSGFYDQISENLRETKSLAEIRDVLMPRLLSGELVLAK
jgi:type I restriction enzyme S subunit